MINAQPDKSRQNLKPEPGAKLMKSLILLLLTLSLMACSADQIQQSIDVYNSYNEQSLSNSEVAGGLREALVQGISRGADQAARNDGFFANPEIKIPFPQNLTKVENALRDLGLGSEIDRFVLTLNRGAEKAAQGAKPIFLNAIMSLTITDAITILRGEPDAATNYLRTTTSGQLRQQFLPVVSQSLEQVNATRYYGDIINQYNRIPLVQKQDPDLDNYATERAIEGLFKLVAQEEANIRANPAARATELMKRVFGSID